MDLVLERQSLLQIEASINGDNGTQNKTQQVANKKQTTSSIEAPVQRNFFNPMFAKLEETVAKNMRQLDEMEEKLNKESYDAYMARITSHIPNEIKGNGQTIEKILKNLDKLLSLLSQPNETDSNNNQANSKIPTENEDSNSKTSNDIDDIRKKSDKLDKLNEIICLASSINTYLRTLNNKFNKNDNINLIPNEIYSNVNLWLARLFRFNNTNTLFHQHDYEAIVYMMKIIIQIKYDKLSSDGYKAYEKGEPVFYVSSASKYAKLEYRQKLCSLLGLPLDSFKLVNVCGKMGSSYDKLDAQNLVDQIEQDIADKKIPQLLVANAGSYNVGQCDGLLELERICIKYRIWLHLDGVHLSTLVLYSVPTVIQPINSGDSISLDFGNWIGVPSLAYVTLFKENENSSKIMEFYQDSWDCLDKSLPYWCLLQAIGHEGVVDRIKYANNLSRHVVETINRQQPFLKLITFKDDPDEQVTTTRKYTFQELISKAISFITLVELNNSVIIFKCNDNYIKDTLYKHNYALRFDKDEEKNEKILNEYCNTLTSWLCDLLNSVHKTIRLDVIDIKEEGHCIRYSPIEHANLLHTSEDDLQQFLKSFEEVLQILDASVKCRALFDTRLTQYTNLKAINISKWAGVGAIRYIPDYLLDKLDHQDEQFTFEVNKINSELVKYLQAQDGAFSLAQTDNGLLGVKFGMVNEVDSLDKLILEVQQAGKTIEESEKFIETVAELVKQGIEKANEDLKRENDKKLYQEGVLRQIPLVSGLMNWWSPKENTSIVGRTFHLKTGKIETTETIYKYHMQIQENNGTNEKPVLNKCDNASESRRESSNVEKNDEKQEVAPNNDVTNSPN